MKYPRCGAKGPDGATCQVHAEAPHEFHEWLGMATTRRRWPNPKPVDSSTD